MLQLAFFALDGRKSLQLGRVWPISQAVPGPKAQRVRVAPPVRRELKALANSTKAEHRLVVRARIVLLAASGTTNAEIAREVGCHEDTVRKWRKRFVKDSRVEALRDRSRSGRPNVVPVSIRCEVVKLACDKPNDYDVPCRDIWTHQALADVLEQQTDWKISRSEVGKILRAEDFRPHHVRNWLHSPDPNFRPKARRICDLYCHPPEGATILSIDEKTSIQALERRHPFVLPAPGKPGRWEFEYIRHGTRCLFGAFDVRTGRVFGRCRKKRTAANLVSFMDAVARQFVPEGEVYVIWDNLNIHYDGRDDRWTEFNKRHGERFHFVYTPLHASWLNQIEIWFSILQRRIIKHGSFLSVAELSRRIMSFIAHWNRYESHPFRWKFRGRFQDDGPRLAA